MSDSLKVVKNTETRDNTLPHVYLIALPKTSHRVKERGGEKTVFKPCLPSISMSSKRGARCSQMAQVTSTFTKTFAVKLLQLPFLSNVCM